MIASVCSGVKPECADTIRFELAILFVVFLRYEIGGILDVLISDFMFVQDPL